MRSGRHADLVREVRAGRCERPDGYAARRCAAVASTTLQGDTVYSESQTELINVAGQTNKGVKSTTTTQITAIRLFKGTANQLTINVLAPPVVTATATGKPGGAKVEYSEPVLQVLDADGNVIGELNAADINLEIPGHAAAHAATRTR